MWSRVFLLFKLLMTIEAAGEKLSMALQQSGFHRFIDLFVLHLLQFTYSCRNLKYVTLFMQPWRPETCDFCIEQSIPSSAYIDTDQLDDLQRFKKVVK